MNSRNLNQDLYQNAIKDGIKEIPESFGKKERIGYGASGLVYKTKCEFLKGIVVAIKEINITSENYKPKTFMNEVFKANGLIYFLYLIKS